MNCTTSKYVMCGLFYCTLSIELSIVCFMFVSLFVESGTMMTGNMKKNLVTMFLLLKFKNTSKCLLFSSMF